MSSRLVLGDWNRVVRDPIDVLRLTYLAAAIAFAAIGNFDAAVRMGLTFGIGLGSALLRPSWQAVQPELVEKDEIPQAAALNGVSMNMARAIGPAIGGVVVAATNAGAVFVANAVSFVGVM